MGNQEEGMSAEVSAEAHGVRVCAGFEGEEYRRDQSTWFSARRKPPVGAAGRNVCGFGVCVRLESRRVSCCVIWRCLGAIQATQEA